jgi:single-strand DNA-binding protein
MNRWIGIGRLARDPEIKYTQTGKAVANFTLATNERGSEKATFVPVIAWEKLAEIIGNNLMKGSQILVEGRMQIRNYEDKNGQKRYVTEVVAQNIEFLGSKPSGQSSMPAGAESFGSEVDDELIPF